MNHITNEERHLLDELHDFMQTDIAPQLAEADLAGGYQPDWFRDIGARGFLALSFPAAYGGRDMTQLSFIRVLEEVSRYSTSLGAVIAAHTHCARLVQDYGSDAQRKAILPKALRGELLLSFAMSEEKSGSDALNIETQAVREGDAFCVNGKKHWISNAGAADVYLLTARTASTRSRRDLSLFLVHRDTPGLTSGRIAQRMGLNNADIGDLEILDCRIPASDIIGEENHGYDIIFSSLFVSRLYHAAVATGTARGALEDAVAVLKNRKPFGRSIGAYQGVTFPIADMYTELLAARSLLYQLAEGQTQGSHLRQELAALKLFATTTCCNICDKAMLLVGGDGYSKELPLERYVRDSRALTQTAGTAEICKVIISNYIF